MATAVEGCQGGAQRKDEEKKRRKYMLEEVGGNNGGRSSAQAQDSKMEAYRDRRSPLEWKRVRRSNTIG